jgi:threonine aldolase
VARKERDVTDRVIDLRSDTLSLPTEEMLESIRTAKLGDDSRDGDPTVLDLEALAARMLGKEAAMLTVSGTMSNVVAMRTSVEPGATAIVEQSAHLYAMEFGGIAAACGLRCAGAWNPVERSIRRPEVRGSQDRRQVSRPLRSCVWRTRTMCPRRAVIPPEHLDVCAEIARAAGMSVHLDGARIFNAAVAARRDVRDFTRSVDSVSFCLSKGLSAPVGSLVVGPGAFVDRARGIRRALGGTMRQAGIIAAPGLVALRTLVDRLAEDHDNAAWFARQVAAIDGLSIDLFGQSNVANVDVRPHHGSHREALTQSVRGLPE